LGKWGTLFSDTPIEEQQKNRKIREEKARGTEEMEKEKGKEGKREKRKGKKERESKP